jgi:hypothetical protein
MIVLPRETERESGENERLVQKKNEEKKTQPGRHRHIRIRDNNEEEECVKCIYTTQRTLFNTNSSIPELMK